MKRDITYWCQGPDCHTHQTTSDERPPQGWLIVQEDIGRWAPGFWSFCGWDCVLKFAGRVEPPDIIPA